MTIKYPDSGAMTFKATVINVHDGDTVTLDIDLGLKLTRYNDRDLGFHIHIKDGGARLHNATRLYGINAPELNTLAGHDSTQALYDKLPVRSAVTVTTWLNHNDKYGRVLGRIVMDGQDINQWILDEGYAVSFDGHSSTLAPKSKVKSKKSRFNFLKRN